VALYDDAALAICELYRVPPDRVTVIPNGRSASEFKPASHVERVEARRLFGLHTYKPVAAIVGALSTEKRVELAIHAISLLDGYSLIVAGDGPLRPKLEQLGREKLGDRIQFLGALTDVSPVYRAVDVVLLPSSTEGMPGTAIEAGFSGIPVAACEVGAMSWLFNRGLQGAWCSVDVTPQQFAEAIKNAYAIGTPCAVLQATHWDNFLDSWQKILEHFKKI
jgi:glycosyltransferase involved in cell wall biosynthesis